MPLSFDSVKAVFEAALDRAPADRAAVLGELCAGDAALRDRVEALLRAHDETDPVLDRPVVDLRPVEPPGPAVEARGMVVAGRYRLREMIGEGGMGSVWLADQTEPVRRPVALKVVKAGLDSKAVLARFAAERQALAVMDHPHIAKVLDGGTTPAGRPFFVMEYVEGVPLTGFCDAERLDVPARLALFVQVCQAVQHAHQKGVIHRDLKPSNILVSRAEGAPVPKVIDFGLAKATRQPLTAATLHTGPGFLMGTLQYMAPEQAELDNPDIDTRADVYALGVILYELLTGTTPVERQQLKQAAWTEVLRLIQEEEPPRPSARLSHSESLPGVAARRSLEPVRLARLVRGDLDWIVMKALEKDRARRYETANGLAADVRRHLIGDPVTAHPPGRAYRLRKFARRHRPQVVAGGLVLAALVAGIVGTTVGLFEARRQERFARDQEAEAHDQERIARGERDAREIARQDEAAQRALAEDRLAKLEKGIEILGAVFAKIDPTAEGRGGDSVAVAVGKQLEQAAAELRGEAVGEPLVVARLQNILGNSLVAVGRAGKAIEVLEPAAATRAARLGDDSLDTLLLRADLATAYANADRAGDGVRLFQAVEPPLAGRLGDTEARVLKVRRDYAAALIADRKGHEAVRLLSAMLDGYRAAGREHDSDALVAANLLARADLAAGKPAEAVTLLEGLIFVIQERFGVKHLESITTLSSLAAGYRQTGRFVSALTSQQKVCELLREKLRDDHPTMLTARYDLALATGDAGGYGEAVSILRSLREICEKGERRGGPFLLHVRHQLGIAYVRAGDPDQGFAMIQWALREWLEQRPIDDPDVLATRQSLAVALAAGGRVGQAVQAFDLYLADGQSGGKQDPVQVLWARSCLADALRRAGKFDRAAMLAAVALKDAEDRLGPEHPMTLMCRDHLAGVRRAQGRPAEAVALLEKNFRPAARNGQDHPDFLRYHLHWLETRLDGGDVPNARPTLERDLESARKSIGDGHPLTLAIAQALADVLEREKAWDRAVAERQRVLAAERDRADRQRAREEMFQKAGIAYQALSSISPFPAAAQAKLGQTLLAAGRFAAAEPPLREALAFMDRLQTDNWDRFAAESMLGEALAGQKKYGDAEPFLLDGHRGLTDRARAIPRPASRTVPRARERLVELYEAWGKPAEAARWRTAGEKK